MAKSAASPATQSALPNALPEGSPGWRFAAGVCGLLLLALVLGARNLDVPGLYYDEAVQARPALEFASAHSHATPLPGSQTLWLGNRALPLLTQPYMGALKSQILIPSIWLTGASVAGLRLTTLVWALCGAGFVAAFSRRAVTGSSLV